MSPTQELVHSRITARYNATKWLSAPLFPISQKADHTHESLTLAVTSGCHMIDVEECLHIS